MATTRIQASDNDHRLTIVTGRHGIQVLDETTGHSQHITATVLETIANLAADGELHYTADGTFGGIHSGVLHLSFSKYDREHGEASTELARRVYEDDEALTA